MSFFRNTWFSRGWTPQELVLASNPVFFSDAQTLAWNEELLVAHRLQEMDRFHPHQHQLVNVVNLWKRVKSATHLVHDASVVSLIIHSLIRRKASYPKDHAYAFYGILHMIGVELTELDYGKSTEAVLHTFFLDMLAWHHSSLALLLVSGKTLTT
jgi:hypothetical protein